MKKKYKIGILGYGGFGQFLHHHWDQLDNVEVVAVSDTRLVSGKHRLPNYPDWNKLLAVPEIDIISIATPPYLHAEAACVAMEQGKHVLIEKPMALSLKDARKIIQARNSSGCVATVNYMMRFNEVVIALKKFEEEQTFGQLRHVAVQNLAQDSSLNEDHWFWDKSRSGGIFLEHAVHFFDLVYFISGKKYKDVNGLSSHRNLIQEDQVFASVQHENDLVSTHYHIFSRPGVFEDTSIRLVYDLAQIEIHGWIPLSGSIKALVNDVTKQSLEKLPGFVLVKKVPVEGLEDQSRPEGWGAHDFSDGEIRSRGHRYQVDEMIEGTFCIDKTKSEVYGNGVQNVLLDMIKKIEKPDYNMSISLEEGMESLEIAIAADNSSRAD